MATIICADDEKFMYDIYDAILAPKGHHVRYCGDGAEVLEAYGDEPADLVILDVKMPAMSGLEVCQRLRRLPEGHDVPIIIVSARDTEDDVMDGLSKGADDYLVKPFKPGEFMAKVNMALQKRHQPAGDIDLRPGNRFADRYEIVESIGEGGFSMVFLAKDLEGEFPDQVALKVVDLGAKKGRDRRFVTLFLREAYEHSRLEHPNIILLYDFGAAGPYYYLAMEYVDGTTLEKMILRNGPLAQDSVAFVGHEMTKALIYMNLFGILHRDIKPGNIMITGAGDIKLLDFGLARREMEDTLSLDEEFRGTPQYAAPEFITNLPDLDIRSDIYSLGVTLYYAATGQKPFTGDSTIDILNRHFEYVPPPVHEVRPEISPELSTILARMIAKDRDERPSLVEVLSAFENCLDATEDD